MRKTYTYDAIINYCRKDVRLAKALYRALSCYKVPRTFVNEVKDDVTIRHIDRFAIYPLDRQCDGNVESSDCLILICSPDSMETGTQDADKINVSVERFIASGRKNRIIPVVVDNTSDILNYPAYVPHAIVDEKIPIVRFRSGNRKEFRMTLLMVICRILNLQSDQFEKLIASDHNRRRRCKRIMLGMLVALLAGAFFIDSERTVVKFYANYVDSFGLPEGIFPLEVSELEHRNVHYRFEYEGFLINSSPHADSADWCIWNLIGIRRKLLRVVQANSHGYPTKSQHPEHSKHPEIQEFKYDDGRLCKIDIFHHSREEANPEYEGCVLLSNLLSDTALKVFGTNQEMVNGFLSFVAPDGKPSDFRNKLSKISNHFVCRDAYGRVKRRLFLNCLLAKIPDENGVYGFQNEHDSLGRPIVKKFLGRKSGVIVCMADYHGIDGMRFQYVERNLSKIEYTRCNSSVTGRSNDWVVCVYDYDLFDNNIRCRVINGTDDVAPCGKGNAGIDAEYDSFGNLTKLVFIKTSGETIDTESSYTEIRREYDEFGNVIKKSFFAADGSLVLCEDGFAVAVSAYEGYGNLIKISYFGVDNKPKLHKDGYAGLKYHIRPDYSYTTEAFDTMGRSVNPYLVVVVADVVPGLSAEKSDIKKGDVICKFNMYDILETESACEAFAPIGASKEVNKDIRLARKIGDDYEIRGYQFPIGTIGIETDLKYIYDQEKLMKAYRASLVEGGDDAPQRFCDLQLPINCHIRKRNSE